MTLLSALLAMLTLLSSARLDAGFEFTTPPWSLVVDPTEGMDTTLTPKHVWTELRVRESAAGGPKSRAVAVAFRLGLPPNVVAEPIDYPVEVTDNTGAKVTARLVAPFGEEEAGLLIENVADQAVSFSIDHATTLSVKGVPSPHMMTFPSRKLSPMFTEAPRSELPEVFMATDRDGRMCIDVVPAKIHQMITDVRAMDRQGNRVAYSSMGGYTSDGEDFVRYTFNGEFDPDRVAMFYTAVRKEVNCNVTFRMQQILVPSAAPAEAPPK